MTFSYHVREADDIKCYLLWSGQCARFYPQDIIDVLPQLFVSNKYENTKFIQSQEAKRLVSKLKIPDPKFEGFYNAMTNDHTFPKQYDI